MNPMTSCNWINRFGRHKEIANTWLPRSVTGVYLKMQLHSRPNDCREDPTASSMAPTKDLHLGLSLICCNLTIGNLNQFKITEKLLQNVSQHQFPDSGHPTITFNPERIVAGIASSGSTTMNLEPSSVNNLRTPTCC